MELIGYYKTNAIAKVITATQSRFKFIDILNIKTEYISIYIQKHKILSQLPNAFIKQFSNKILHCLSSDSLVPQMITF